MKEGATILSQYFTVLAAFLSVFLSLPARASMEFYLSSGYLGIASGSKQIDLAPGLQYQPFSAWPWFQAGGEIIYQTLSHEDGSTKNMVILAGVTGNVGGAGLADATFISLGIAMKSGSSDLPSTSSTSSGGASTSPNGTGFYFLAGKRFPLGGGAISYRPSAGVIATGSTGLVFRPLAFSLFF